MLMNPLTQERVELIETLDDILESWDGTAEKGPEVIAELHSHIEELKFLQPVENDFDRPPYSSRESKLLINIYRKEKLLVHVMRMRKQKLSEEMKNLHHKEKMVHHYLIPHNKPTFVNKGI